jgi:hypothetical protein
VTVAFTCLNVVSDFHGLHVPDMKNYPQNYGRGRTVYHCSTAEEHGTRLRIPGHSKIYTVLKNLISRTCGLWILERTSFFFHSKKKTEKKTQWSHMRGGAIIWNSFVSSVGSRFILKFPFVSTRFRILPHELRIITNYIFQFHCTLSAQLCTRCLVSSYCR